MSMPRSYHRIYIKKYYLKRRNEMIALLGGKCSLCPETEHLHFDHIDPNSREFKIGKLLSYSKKALEKEINKCQLLCQKHHIEKTKKDGSVMKNRPIGSRVGSSKLVEEQVRDIKIKIKEKVSFKELANKYGVCLCTIKFISTGRIWKHVVL